MAKGIARIYDAVLAMTLLLIALTITLGYANSFNVYEGPRDLIEFSSNLLIYLDRNNLLAPMVYREEYERLEKLVSDIVPEGIGFKISVYNCDWKILWSINHQFKQEKSSSASLFLSGYEGVPDPRVVVLSLSR